MDKRIGQSTYSSSTAFMASHSKSIGNNMELLLPLCSCKSLHSFGKLFLLDSGVCLWEYLPILSEEHLWDQTLMFGLQSPCWCLPKASVRLRSGLSVGQWSSSTSSYHLSMPLRTLLLCALGHTHTRTEKGLPPTGSTSRKPRIVQNALVCRALISLP